MASFNIIDRLPPAEILDFLDKSIVVLFHQFVVALLGLPY